MTVRDLLLRGLFAGCLAATLAFGFAFVVEEPQLERAIAFEEAMQRHSDAVATATTDDAPVSRAMQRTLGLAAGFGFIGVAAGGVFALAFAAAYRRVGSLGARGTALALALAAFEAVTLVPWLKYPANPPGAGDLATLGARTAAYFALMLIAVVATGGAAVLWRRLAARRSAWDAALIASGALLLVLALAFVLLPPAEVVPAGFPAETLWLFRIAAAGTPLVLWTGIGLIFGVLVERLEARATHAPTRPRARA